MNWISDCINYLDQKGAGHIEPDPAAEDAWVRHVYEIVDGTMLTSDSCNSWYLGANIPGKPRIFMPYVAGVGVYRDLCDEIVADDYRGFIVGEG